MLNRQVILSLKELREAFEHALPNYLPEIPLALGGRVTEAARYSLCAGGKRIRPLLLLTTAQATGATGQAPRLLAAALELIHTYSLIHDDLPAMDNDDLRRGRPTCHRVYGEATALLAGDLLLNRACELTLAAVNPMQPETLEAARVLFAASGADGMIGGQMIDLDSVGQTLDEAALNAMHSRKTGALIRAGLCCGGLLGRASDAQMQALERLGTAMGIAFQIRDDLLDVSASAQDLGKTPGKDARDDKSTYITRLGEQQARKRLAAYEQEQDNQLELLLTNDHSLAWQPLFELVNELKGRKK